MANPKQLTIFRWLILLLIPLLWCGATWIGAFDFIENRLTDVRFRFRGELPASVKVVYVDVDSESITDLGAPPWDRGYFAEVSDALIRLGNVTAVGIDYVFSEKGQPELTDRQRFAAGNRRLAEMLFNGAPMVLAAGYASSDDRDINGNPFVRKLPRRGDNPADALPPELPEFREGDFVMNAPNVGLIDTLDSGTRWVPLFARVGEITYFHMAVELARLHWKITREQIQITDRHLRFVDAAGKILSEVPLTDGQDVEVNWFSRWSSPEHNPRASFADVLVHARNAAGAVPAEVAAARAYFDQFKNSIVLIGPVDPLLQDVAPTPMDRQPVPRVGIHGNLLKTIVSQKYIHHLPFWAQAAVTFLVTLFVSLLAVGAQHRQMLSRVGAVVLVLAYVAAAFVVFSSFHLLLPIAMPVGAAFMTSFAAVGWQLFREEKQKGRIKSMFGTYVSPELVNRMIESGDDPKLGGAEVAITAYFSDIQDFSSFSERLSPTQVVELMNEYLTACTDVIRSEGGTLDKYIGDAVVAMFGAPVALTDHAYRACRASVIVQQRLEELRAKWGRDEGAWTAVAGGMKTRIGLNSGTAVVGNIGSQVRFNYTMMGDSVNLAARLESGAKQYGAGTLVSEETKRACELRSTECLFRFLDRIVVKGRTKPVSVYELIGFKDQTPASVRDSIAAFEEGMEAYLRQNWRAASDKFAHSLKLSGMHGLPVVTPASVYLQRCDLMTQQPPPPDWDGVWVMRSK